jgi:AraC family transcriptional regulator of adaptative response / DNA-3-methyladenine glycosylase II
MLENVMDDDACYRALASRDSAFDGRFFVAVRTTGIYCRPSCPATTPKRVNVSFHPTAASAQAAGYRACKRCRPDAVPGSPEWNARADLVGRAMRSIADGVVDREGVAGLAQRLGYSERHLNRQLAAEVGAGPLALARAQRAQTARVLLETTDVVITDVAFAAGFTSIRQFNDTVRDVFAATPTELRASRRVRSGPVGSISLRLPFRPPLAAAQLFGFLALRAVPGVEEGSSTGYRRTLSLAHGVAVVELGDEAIDSTDAARGGRVRRPEAWLAEHWVPCRIKLADLRDLGAAVARCRRLLDLDADPRAIDDVLSGGPGALLAESVARLPGIRLPGHVDGAELAVRAVLGQQVSVAGARTLARRLVDQHGRALAVPDGSLTHTFPSAEALARVDPDRFPMPRSRAAALSALARALAAHDIELDPGADRDQTTARLMALPGIGAWTSDYIRMRALGDPDVAMEGDLGFRHGLRALGGPTDPRAVAAIGDSWAPWRSYALQHIWAAASSTVYEERSA